MTPDPEAIYREMLTSTTAMLAAEQTFTALRHMYRTHPRYQHLTETDQDLRHAADPRTKQAITLHQHHRDRAHTLAAVYQTIHIYRNTHP